MTISPTWKIAEANLSYQYSTPFDKRKFIKQSSDAYGLIKPYYQPCMDLQEVAYAIFLNSACHVIAVYKLSEGGVGATIMDVKLLLCAALKTLAHNIILCHNHPNGTTTPSKYDVATTRKIADAAKLLDMRVMYHIIITSEKYYSMADNGEIE